MVDDELLKFMKRVKPAAPRSQLAAHWESIKSLREHGYTLEQVCEYLAAKGVQITVAGLSNYIRRRKDKASEEAPVTQETTVSEDEDQRPPGMSDAAWSQRQVEIKRSRKKH